MGDNETTPPQCGRDYTGNGSMLETSLSIRIPNAYCMPIVVAISLALNSLAMAVFLQPRLSKGRPAIYYYLIALALWDVAQAIGAFLMVSVPALLYEGSYEMGHYSYIIPYVYYINQATLIGSVWVILTLTVDRYLALCYPLTHNALSLTKIRRILLLVSLSACMYSMPDMFYVIVDYCSAKGPNGRQHLFPFVNVRKSMGDSELYMTAYRVIGNLLVRTLLPYIVLLVLTIRISFAIKTASDRRRAMSCAQTTQISRTSSMKATSFLHKSSDGDRDNGSDEVRAIGKVAQKMVCRSSARRSQQSGNIMLMTVVLKFLLCRLLITVLDVVDKLPHEEKPDGEVLGLLTNISNVLVVVNSATNFFIYALFSTNFRDTIRGIATGEYCDRRSISRRGASLYDGGSRSNLPYNQSMHVSRNQFSNASASTSTGHRLHLQPMHDHQRRSIQITFDSTNGTKETQSDAHFLNGLHDNRAAPSKPVRKFTAPPMEHPHIAHDAARNTTVVFTGLDKQSADRNDAPNLPLKEALI